MWVPRTTEQLCARLSAGDLEESASFDGKRGLGADNANIAADICAMTVAGGVLVYGIGENAEGTRLTEAHPIALVGVRERLSQIAATSIAEPPTLQITALEEPEEPGMGYVIVQVPPSPRAPHQVIVRGKHRGRFYGRDATGNRILGESEVAALYARRERLEGGVGLNLEARLREYSSEAFGLTPQRVYMLLAARPLTADDGLTQRAGGPPGVSDVPHQLEFALEEGSRVQAGGLFKPNLQWLAGRWRRADADSWSATYETDNHVELEMRVWRDGSASLYSRRAGDQVGGEVVVFERTIAGLTAGFLRTLGGLYWRAGYIGAVDCGLVVRPLAGLTGSQIHQQGDRRPYGTEAFERSVRSLAGALRDESEQVARSLVGDLMAAMVSDSYNPFA